MAGPGIRYRNVATTLGKHFPVSLAFFSNKSVPAPEGVSVINPDSAGSYEKAFDTADVIFAQWLSRPMINYAKARGITLVFDLYAPVPIEYLASLEFSSKPITPDIEAEFDAIVDMYNNYFSVGSFFTCSNERQRDFWLGYLTANRVLRPGEIKNRDLLNKLALCPMGIEEAKPKAANLALRKRLNGVNKDDFVLLWTGGIWDWFDATLVIRALSLIKDKRIKLVFLGTKHPNDTIAEMNESIAARKLSDKLGLTDKRVFFLDGWVPYNERANYLLDADASVYADKESLETRFSHRTRVLDHFWAEIPTICPRGDYMSDLVEAKALGITVGDRTAESFAAAIESLASDKKLLATIHKNLARQRANFTWDSTLQPLVTFIKNIDLDKPIILPDEAPLSHSPDKAPIKRRIKQSIKVLIGRQ